MYAAGNASGCTRLLLANLACITLLPLPGKSVVLRKARLARKPLRMFAAFHVAFVAASDNVLSSTSNTSFSKETEIEESTHPDWSAAPPPPTPSLPNMINE